MLSSCESVRSHLVAATSCAWEICWFEMDHHSLLVLETSSENGSTISTTIRGLDDCRESNLSVGNLVERGMIEMSEGCSSVEQDPAPLERLFGDGDMSPISVRRESFENWSTDTRANQKIVSEEEEKGNIEEQDALALSKKKSSEFPNNEKEHEDKGQARTSGNVDYAVVFSRPHQDDVEWDSQGGKGLDGCSMPQDEQDIQECEGSALVASTTLKLSPAKGERCQPSNDVDDLSDDGENKDKTSLSLHSISRALNESAETIFNVDINSAKQKIDASSQAFMAQLRGAANRRKNQVIRSRDSLVAKQKERSENQTNVVEFEMVEPEVVTPKQQKSTKTFKALPMPLITGSGQVGVPKVDKRPQTTPFSPLLGPRRQQICLPLDYGSGQVGVPLVDKRPPTKPFSPLLGAKREQKIMVAALQHPPPLVRTIAKARVSRANAPPSSEHSFRARPLPTGFGQGGYGQVGIPKISKRPATIPRSPLLGVRRHDVRPGRIHSSAHKSDSSMGSLVGLNLLSPAALVEFADVENRPPVHANTPERQKTTAYIPHSTKRAKERAQYDRIRLENEAKRMEAIKLAWKQEIMAKRAEIAKLRGHL